MAVEVVASHDHLQKDNDAERNWRATPVRWKAQCFAKKTGGCRCSVGALPSSTGHSPIRHRYLSAARSPPWNWPALPMLARPAPTSPWSPRTQALRQRSQPRVPWRDVRASTVRQNEIRPLPVVGAKCVSLGASHFSARPTARARRGEHPEASPVCRPTACLTCC